jgi:hypothetical protein
MRLVLIGLVTVAAAMVIDVQMASGHKLRFFLPRALLFAEGGGAV